MDNRNYTKIKKSMSINKLKNITEIKGEEINGTPMTISATLYSKR